MDKNKILLRLKSDYQYVESLGYNVLGVFLQGSQNYELDYEGSDIDTKVIIIPKFEDFVFKKKPVSTTLILDTNEHIDVKDIRLMHECFRKQNINFLEILFTKYKILNPKYQDLYQPMFDNRELIAHFNTCQAIRTMYGMALEKRKALTHPYPNKLEVIEKFGYDPKQLHHILRLFTFIDWYSMGKPYEECLVGHNKDFLIKVKRDGVGSLEQAEDLANTFMSEITSIKEIYLSNFEKDEINQEALDIMNNVLIDVLKYSFKMEILEEEQSKKELPNYARCWNCKFYEELTNRDLACCSKRIKKEWWLEDPKNDFSPCSIWQEDYECDD